MGAYFILKNPGSLPETKSIAGNNPLAQTNPIKWAEQPGKQIAQAANSYNATDFFAKSLFEKFKILDQNGKDPFASANPNDPNNQNFVKGVAEQLSKETLSFDQAVSDGDLKISPDNSREAKIGYLQSVAEITKNRFSDAKYQRSADQIISDIENDCTESNLGLSTNGKIADLYNNLVNDYLNLSTPSDYLSFHKSIIAHFRKSEAVYGALANCFNDPLKGYMAAQNLPQLITNVQQIQLSLLKKSKEVGLD